MPKKILVVDDDPVSAHLIASTLKSQGFEVASASDGLDALVKIKQESPDLIVLDVVMPEINGYDVCYQLRFNKEFEKIPIILLTERDQELHENIGRSVNIAYAPKPVDIQHFLAQVHNLLSK